MPHSPVSASSPSPVAGLVGMREVLNSVTAEGVDDAGWIELIAQLESLKGVIAAAQARVTARAVEDREELGEDSRSVRAEIALARRCSPHIADRLVGVAKALVGEMPHTMGALERGEGDEDRALLMVKHTAHLSFEHRGEVDRQLGPMLGGLGPKELRARAQEVAAALDSEALARAHEQAVASRRVTVRPAANGMAWLSVLGPMVEVIGAHAALAAAERRRWVIDPDLPEHEHTAALNAARADTRGKGAWMTDAALALLSGRSDAAVQGPAQVQVQPVAVNVVMTDTALLPGVFGQAPEADLASIPGHGPIPGAALREHISTDLDNGQSVAVRRLFTDPTGTNLTGMDSKQRFFTGNLRTFLGLRDPICRVPYCGAPAVHFDHITRAADGGPTSLANGCGLCERHNQVKEHPGWHTRVTHDGTTPGQPHTIEITTPTGRTYNATAPPLSTLNPGATQKRVQAASLADGEGDDGDSVSLSETTSDQGECEAPDARG